MRRITRRAMLAGAAALPAAALPLPALGSGLTEAAGTAFGTYWRALVPGRREAREAEALAADLLPTLDAVFSPWRADAELARFNSSVDPVIELSRELGALAARALEIARETRGAFDPTVGPEVARRGFGPIRHGAGPDWRGLSVSGSTIRRKRAGLTLDLCGIAKGHAVDRLLQALAARGISDMLVDMGGELRALGRHPSGREWRAAVAMPFAPEGTAAAVVAPGGLALATSGLAEQSYPSGETLTGHIIGAAEVLSASVLGPDAATADALATALAAMPAITARRFAESMGLATLLITGSAGAPQLEMTAAFAARLAGRQG